MENLVRFAVAPLAGAWIEIMNEGSDAENNLTSLPSRERGLKLLLMMILVSLNHVAPLAGAWIEM